MAAKELEWDRHPLGARLLRVVTLAMPLGGGVVAGLCFALVVRQPTGLAPGTFWWAGVFSVSSLAIVGDDRLARRLLPLALLLDLSLLFPETAPSRFRMALRAGSARRLREQVERAQCGSSA